MKKQLPVGSSTYHVNRTAGRGLILAKLLALMFVLPLGCIAAAQSNKPPRIGYLGYRQCSSADGSVSTGICTRLAMWRRKT